MAQTDIIKVHRLGHTFRASRRTVAHLDYTIKKFKRHFPEARLVIFQTPYNTSVEKSKGTHDLDCCFDFGFTGKIPGLTAARKWRRFERFMRNHGWGIWWRHTGSWAARRAWHLHGFCLPVGLRSFDTKVGYLVDGGLSTSGHKWASSQLFDYVEGRDGMASHLRDDGYRVEDLMSVVFNYHRWVQRHGAPKGIGE